MSLRSVSAITAVFLAAAACAPRIPKSPANVVLFEALGTATIDGQLSQGEWDPAQCEVFLLKTPGATNIGAELCIMNDGQNLYALLAYPRTVVDPMLQFSLTFNIPLVPDQGGGKSVDAISLQGGTQGTFPFTDTFEGPTGGDDLDTSDGGTTDGSGVLSTGGGAHIYELAHPLDSADDKHDFSLKGGDVIGFCANVAIGSERTHFPSSCGGPSSGSAFGRITIASVPVGGTMYVPELEARVCSVTPELCEEPDPPRHRCADKPALCQKPEFQNSGMFLYCTIKPCVVHDELPKNCMRKFPCPVPPGGGGGTPPYYHLTFTGLNNDWDVVLVDREGGKVPHRVVPIEGGVVVSFQPDRARHMPGLIGDYAAMFVMRDSGKTGVRYNVGARLATSDRHFDGASRRGGQ